MSEKMSCGHSRSEVVSSRGGESNWCGACEREASKFPVDSFGECSRCGCVGPGPGHICRSKIGGDCAVVKFSNIRKIPRAPYMVNVAWSYLEEWLKDGESLGLDMDPPYQRGYVWSERQKVEYLEYILRDGTSGKDIYWNCPGWMRGFEGPLELVDGKQRVSAVLEFLSGKIAVFGHFIGEYQDKPDMLVARFNVHVHDLKDPRNIVQWYLDMNTGGSIHTEKDLRPAREYMRQLMVSSGKVSK